MKKNETIEEFFFDGLAKQTRDPMEYVLVLIRMGFNAKSQKQKAVKCWNRYHKDRELPIPIY